MPASQPSHSNASAFKRWRRLAHDEKVFVLTSAICLVGIWLSLHTLGFRRTSRLFAGKLVIERPARGQWSTALRYANLVRATAELCLPSGSCLPQAIVLSRLLRRRGFESQLKIGVRGAGQSIEAHAWVEYEGKSLDQESDRYSGFENPILPGKSQMRSRSANQSSRNTARPPSKPTTLR